MVFIGAILIIFNTGKKPNDLQCKRIMLIAMNRRHFIKLAAGSTVLTSFVPSLSLAYNPKVSLYVTVDKLENDFLSTDYHENCKNSFIGRALEKTKDFYGKIGDAYNTDSIDMNIIHSPAPKNSEGSLKFRYTYTDVVMEELENYENLLENVLGSERIGKIGPVFASIARDAILENIRNHIGDSGGCTIPGKKEIFLIPKEYYNMADISNQKYSNNLVSILSFIVLHETGHAFGLNHVEKGPDNDMNVMTIYPEIETFLNPMVTEEQVRKILKKL